MSGSEQGKGTPEEIFPENLLPTPQDFLDNNRAETASNNREIFYGRLNNGKIFMILRCSDARGNIPEIECIDISNIATEGPHRPYGRMMIDDSVEAIIKLTHFSGENFRLGQCPTGCGGLLAKRRQLALSGNNDKNAGLARYIEAIKSDDPVFLAYLRAKSIASHTPNKYVMAGIQDHVSGIIFPIATFYNDNGEIITREKEELRYMIEGRYDPRKIYANGIPSLNPHKLPDAFKEFLQLNRNQIARLESEYPNLHEMLRIQDPNFVVITTEKMAARARYPRLLKKPGSYFQIHIPRDKNDQVIHIEQKTIETAVEQSEYPLEHFSNVHTILIETGDIEQSRRIARSILANEKGQEWHQRPGHQILVGESRAAKTVRMEVFKS